MSEKKELNQEELEKISGGKLYNYIDNIVWMFSKDEIVKVKLEDNTLVTGKVTKRGVFSIPGNSYCTDAYYVESTENSSVNAWYIGDSFSNEVVSIYNKVQNSDLNIGIKPW